MARHSEQGESLIELLFAVVILGLTAGALLSGLGSGIFSTGLHRQQADVATILSSSGEAVLDQTRNPFVPSAGTADYNPVAHIVLPPTWTPANVAVTGVQHWDGKGVLQADGSTQFPASGCSDLVSAPGSPGLTTQSAGGVLSSGTYSYRLLYTNSLGDTLPGPAATTVASGAANQVTVSWSAPPAGVTTVSVYGRTAGNEKLLASILVQTSPTSDSFIDTGSVAPAGGLPMASGNLQLITIKVTSPNGQSSVTRSFVKRGP